MTHNITPQQGTEEAKNLKAAMWANRIMTRKINNSMCKHEIAQSTTSDLIEDMEQRVGKYLKAGLVTAEAFIKPIDNELERLRAAARAKPIVKSEKVTGSTDGLWRKKL